MKLKPALMLAPLLLAFLPSCGPDVRVERIVPPANRLTCAPEPVPPAGDSDKDVAGFIVDVLSAGADCRNALAWISVWAKDGAK